MQYQSIIQAQTTNKKPIRRYSRKYSPFSSFLNVFNGFDALTLGGIESHSFTPEN